ncbi:MAG: class II glutamine amidotransferase [Desulfobacterales bacterium]|nr:MAG: class II glutamine amidotransferase [Desulfobacterales bacterium]
MCRLLAIYGKVRFWKEIALEFQKLAESGLIPPVVDEPGHRDGWGMAGASDDQTTMFEIARRAEAADLSLAFRQTLESLDKQPPVFLIHLRKASPGVPVTIDNVHPFFNSGWAFCHNGTVHDPETLPRNRDFKLTSRGSDSEYLFHFLLTILSNRQANQNLLETVSKNISALKTRYTALNCILSNGRELFVIRHFNQFAAYYGLYFYRLPKGMVICSEVLNNAELDRDKWQEIPNRSILRISGQVPNIQSFPRIPQ